MGVSQENAIEGVKAVADLGATLGGISLSSLSAAIASNKGVRSLADLGRPARVEPLVVVEKRLADQDYMPDLMQSSMSIFMGYYLQAVNLVMNVGRIDTIKLLDALNPHRTFTGAHNLKNAVWSKEAYEHGLPSLEALQEQVRESPIPLAQLIELTDEQLAEEAALESDDDEKKSDGGVKFNASPDSLKAKIQEDASLAVGKLINVEIQEGDHKAQIPVQIRAVPTSVPTNVLTHIFTAVLKSGNIKERYHLWRAGQIRFFKDLVLNFDLIDEHRRALVNDTSNVYMSINKRRTKNNAVRASGGGPSMADASNIVILSKETAKLMGREIYGTIDNLKTRQRIFNNTYLLLMIVVDEEWERVSIYHRGLDEPTEASFRDLKSSEKGKGPDITEILKAYTLGSTPSI